MIVVKPIPSPSVRLSADSAPERRAPQAVDAAPNMQHFTSRARKKNQIDGYIRALEPVISGLGGVDERGCGVAAGAVYRLCRADPDAARGGHVRNGPDAVAARFSARGAGAQALVRGHGATVRVDAVGG